MSGMKTALRAAGAMLAGLLTLGAATLAQTGSVEFSARATPTAGLEEPVRGFPFYLLRKSFEDIRGEAEASDPKPERDAFIDQLDLSPQLKAWMKKHRRISLSGDDFVHSLTASDIMDVPEFHQAYLDRVSGDRTVNLPKPKYKAADKAKDPEKYERLSAEYSEAIRQFIEQHPQTIEGIDLALEQIDPGRKWSAQEAERVSEVRRRALDLAQSKYLVARVETNLEGQGSFRDIPPGTYWLSTLDVTASVGDARPRWDVPVSVRAGSTTRVALSNANAAPPKRSSP